MSRILLRAVEPADADTFYRADNDMAAWDDSDTVAPYSLHMLRHYAANYDADPFSCGQLRLVAVLADEPEITVGLLDLYEISLLHSTAWIGIYVLPEMRRRGYAAEMLSLAAAYARMRLHLSMLGARILDTNPASTRLFEKAGFSHCGTLPAWRIAAGSRRAMHLYALPLFE